MRAGRPVRATAEHHPDACRRTAHGMRMAHGHARAALTGVTGHNSARANCHVSAPPRHEVRRSQEPADPVRRVAYGLAVVLLAALDRRDELAVRQPLGQREERREGALEPRARCSTRQLAGSHQKAGPEQAAYGAAIGSVGQAAYGPSGAHDKAVDSVRGVCGVPKRLMVFE